MAAPSSTKWGNIITGDKDTRKGQIGIYAGVTETATTVTVSIEVWFRSMYSLNDTSNSYYYNAGATSATTLIGSKTINHTVNTGSGWSASNQTKLGSSLYTYNKGTSASTKNYAAKLTGIENLGSGAMTATTSVTVPALASYTVAYDMNGGSGSISSQKKYYGKTLTLSSTKPTRAGYSFQGWATSASGSVAYTSGASYTANAAVTLYAVWKANTYAIKYDANGGTGAPTAQTKTHGKTLTLSTVKPTRSDYNFKGWATSKTATKATYAAGASYTANAAATLYAVWELAYVKPRITGFVLSRCDSEGTTTDEGTYAVVGFSWASDLTVSSIKIEWKLASATSYTTANSKTIEGLSGKKGSVNEIVGAGKIDNEKTYTFRITVADGTDDSHKTQKTSNLSGSIYHIDCKPPTTAEEVGGVSIGKPAELDGVFDVGFEARFRDSVSFDSPAAARASLKVWCFDDTVSDKYTGSKYVGLARPDGTTTGWTRVTQTGLLPYESGGESSSLGTSVWPFKNGYFKNLYADGNDMLNGSGWKTATLTSDFVKYDAKDDNIPQYIKIGKLVQVRGAVSPKAAIAGSATAHTIFTLPEGYRPSKQVSVLSPGSGSNQWLLTITAAGAVRFARYNNGAGYVDAATNAWLSFHAMYFVD